MKIAIVSNIDKIIDENGAAQFVRGAKSIRRIVENGSAATVAIGGQIVDDYLGDPYNPNDDNIENVENNNTENNDSNNNNAENIVENIVENDNIKSEEKSAEGIEPVTLAPQTTIEMRDWQEVALTQYITDHIGVTLSVTAPLVENQLYLTRVTETHYELYITELTIVKTYLFISTPTITSRYIGKYYVMPVDSGCDIINERIGELTNLISSVIGDRNNILAESCSLKSALTDAQSQNEFLVGLLEKCQLELTNKFDLHDQQLNELMKKVNRLDISRCLTATTAAVDRRRPTGKQLPAVPRTMSLPDQLISFDRSTLRRVSQLSQTSLI